MVVLTILVMSNLNELFDYIGHKTASFYMKFIAWVFDLDFVSVVVDRHVIKSLNNYGYLSNDSIPDAKEIIHDLSSKLNVPVVEVETALYEDGWLKSNEVKSSR